MNSVIFSALRRSRFLLSNNHRLASLPFGLSGAYLGVHTRGISLIRSLSYLPLQPAESSPPSWINARRFSLDVRTTERGEKNDKTKEDVASGIKIALEQSQKTIIAAEKAAIEAVLRAVQSIDEDGFFVSEDVALLREEAQRLGDGLFLLVVCGEFNGGKSSVINCLIGKKLLEEGPTPTTSEVTLLKWGEDRTAPSVAPSNGAVVVSTPVDVLRHVHIVDTPGTNAVDRRHEVLTKKYVPRADMVLFVTSADRPFSESERVFLQSIRDWGKKVVLVLNKIDLLDPPAVEKVVAYVEDHARALLGCKPRVFPVSARLGFDSKVMKTAKAKWDESQFGAFESYISSALDSDERLHVKLDATAAVGLTLARKYLEMLQVSERILKADRKALMTVKSLLNDYKSSLQKGFTSHFAKVDNVFLKMLERSDAFLDSKLVLSNVLRLFHVQNIAKEYTAVVVQDAEKRLERQVHELGEWASEKTGQSFSNISNLFEKRMNDRENLFPSHPSLASLSFKSSEFERISYDQNSARRALISGLSEAAASFLTNYNKQGESQRIGHSVSVATATAVAIEIGAIGAVGALLQASALDLAGVASTLGLATVGLLVLPRKRRVLRKEIRARINILRSQIESDMKSHVDELTASHVERILDLSGPFERFTESRMTVLSAQMRNLYSAKEQLESVRNQLSSLGSVKSGK